MVRKLSGFNMTIQVFDPYVSAETLQGMDVRPVSLNELLATSDFVSIQCALTPETRHLIGEAELRRMRPTASIVNVARGAIIDEQL